jgi:hypothetical protein
MTGISAEETSPISWNIGSQKAPATSGPSAHRLRIAATLCRTLPCVSMTPFGVPVDPDEYWRYAIVPESISGAVQPSAAWSSTASVAIGCNACRPLVPIVSSRICASVPVVDSRSAGCALSTIERQRRASAESGLVRSIGAAGTAMTPAYRHPKNAVRKSRPAG